MNGRNLLIASLMTLSISTTAHADSDILLANGKWKVAINPESMQVAAILPGDSRPSLILSAARQKAAAIAHLKHTTQQAQWELPGQKVAVTMRLEDNTLVVGFTASSVREFTWPIIRPQNTLQGFILPWGEGIYAPAQDASWSTFLSQQDPLSTTENLYQPFWGLDYGKYKLTYILTNPFNNELAFQNVSEKLAAQLTHTFTRNQKIKQYGFRISLSSGSPTEPAKRYRQWLIQTRQFVTLKEKIKRIPDVKKLLGAAHIYLWGDGVSPEMMETFHKDGLDHLWLGSPGWQALQDNPEAVRKAKAYGYLIGPYDSYDSVHSPTAAPDDTWETAQFDQKLYDTGAIILASGQKKSGFQQKGYYLNAGFTRPYVEKRMTHLVPEFKCNSWFIDCDAAGQFFDDYSPLHPATQTMEMQARLDRMAWIRDTYGLVIGSEGGASYAASTIHFAHGMMTPLFGWGDLALKEKKSPYFLGAYYPPNAPALFFKPVLLKPSYYRFYFDPRFRLPLYQTVFHDSVVTTHHWTLPTLKFSDQITERSLLELLYNVPPLYHLNQQTFARQKNWIKTQYAFFSPLHREMGLLPLTDFSWLTKDHLVQKTVFGGKIEMVANFGAQPFRYKGRTIPARSILAQNYGTGSNTIFTPASME